MAAHPKQLKWRLFQLLVWTLSLIGLTIQSYYITAQYASYDTVTTVSYGRPSVYMAPKMVICFPNLARDLSTQNSTTSPYDASTVFFRIQKRTRYGQFVSMKRNHNYEIFIKRDDLCYSVVPMDTDSVDMKILVNGDPSLYAIMFSKRIIRLVQTTPSNRSSDPVMFYLHSNQTFYADSFCFVWLMTDGDGADVTYTKIEEPIVPIIANDMVLNRNRNAMLIVWQKVLFIGTRS